MTKRFRMIAGPNGFGKSTLVGLLRRDYAVNFYTMLNADEILAEVSKTRAYLPALPVDRESLLRYALASEYNSQTKSFFESGEISVADDTVQVRCGNQHIHSSLTDKLLAKRAHRKWEKLLPGDGILSSVKD